LDKIEQKCLSLVGNFPVKKWRCSIGSNALHDDVQHADNQSIKGSGPFSKEARNPLAWDGIVRWVFVATCIGISSILFTDIGNVLARRESPGAFCKDCFVLE
jgi:hypothetical protein